MCCWYFEEEGEKYSVLIYFIYLFILMQGLLWMIWYGYHLYRKATPPPPPSLSPYFPADSSRYGIHQSRLCIGLPLSSYKVQIWCEFIGVGGGGGY